ncbi:MAG: universal stress protein [Acidobacteria bacterium]|nr:universal stress protein [Acidobacteriota bacterium]MBI3423729.1 universal stress protein [Acidobacteriota bacterium]
MKILIGVDDSNFSQAAVEAVARRSWAAGTEVKVVFAIEPPFTPEATVMGRAGNHYEIARRALDRAVSTLRGSDNHFELIGDIIEGAPKQVLLDEAEAWGADLLVVGSHGRRGLDRFLLGSVSQAVALHAPCSVEIVRVPLSQAALQTKAAGAEHYA